jgi:antitoxin ChpS
MSTVVLRKVGRSLMVTIPAEMVKQLDLKPGQEAQARLDGARLDLDFRPVSRPHYRLSDLIAQCDLDAPVSDEEREWMDMPSAGREIIE